MYGLIDLDDKIIMINNEECNKEMGSILKTQNIKTNIYERKQIPNTLNQKSKVKVKI